MDCSVTLFYRPVAFGENHAYFEVTVNGFSSILEGEPERNVTVKNAASMVLKYGLNPFGKLIAVDTSGTAGDPNHPGDNPGSDKSSGSVEGGLPVCELAGQLIYDAQIFKPDKWYRPLGPNSNSFAWWLAINANGFLGKSYFQEPPNVPGWGMNP